MKVPSDAWLRFSEKEIAAIREAGGLYGVERVRERVYAKPRAV